MILASASPRRKELLSTLVADFKIIPTKIDERSLPLEQLSLLKAKEISKTNPNELILAADTFVVLNNEVLEKPIDEEDAKRMLKLLSNKAHQVITFYTLLKEDENIEITRKIVTDVYFNELSDSLINEYVETGSPLDKAGAYGIQDSFPLVKKIEGSYTNVVGLPIEEVKKDLINLGIRPKSA